MKKKILLLLLILELIFTSNAFANKHNHKHKKAQKVAHRHIKKIAKSKIKITKSRQKASSVQAKNTKAQLINNSTNNLVKASRPLLSSIDDPISKIDADSKADEYTVTQNLIQETNQKDLTIKTTTTQEVVHTEQQNKRLRLDLSTTNKQPKLYSYSALVLDANSGNVLVNKNSRAQLPIASITKLMTAMVVLDSKVDLDEYITITAEDIDKLRNTFSRLKTGMQLRRRDLLLLALMSSENRAAHALARTAYPGGLKTFIVKMNEKAKALGMNNTQFYDPTGLTTSNQSTAEDLSKMVQEAFSYDIIRKYTTTKNADVQLSRNAIHRYVNSDALVRTPRFEIGLSKTGFINEAGHCLVLYSIISKRPIIMVFLNSAGTSGRILDALAVKNYILTQG